METTKWGIDPVHSEITFKVKHMMITTVTGYFKDYSVDIETEGEDFNKAKKIEFTADINSIDTGNEQRNAHLRSSDFFGVDSNPKLKFTASKLEINGDEGKLTGDLSIAGVTKPITLDVEFGGIISDPYGGKRAGFNLTGKISRKEFGMKYNALLEAGGTVVSDEVKIYVNAELVKEKAEA